MWRGLLIALIVAVGGVAQTVPSTVETQANPASGTPSPATVVTQTA